MCDKAFSEESFILKCCLDRYKTQKICAKSVDNFLPTLKFVPDWVFKSKMIKKRYNALFSDDDLLFFDRDSGNVTFSSHKMSILSVDLNIINLDEDNFLKMILKLSFMSDSWLATINLTMQSILKIYKQRINACSMASNKMVRLVHVRR